ncbi:MAG TPA: diaminopimelate epimerase [Steroidobacteraceae bacterium]|jgi:diaminopimelate epimerase|nr:diaminopimelate epimerase [Steroidobacteraceae bacterium]
MRIEFLKMQGLGNDFMVFDAAAIAADAPLDERALRALADRHTGVGFDQALMLETPRDPASRAFYRIFNSDGGEVEQCGNGARCIAALLYARAPELGRDLIMGSPGGRVRARIRDDGLVSVDMGIPKFEEPNEFSLKVESRDVTVSALSLGNPHAVLRVADVETAPVELWGPSIQRHPHFPNRANVGFMQIVERGHIALRVFERGAGETRACGTGACAAVATGARQGLLDGEVRVDLPGGTAIVTWEGPGQHIWLTGPATTVFTGSIDLTRFTGAKQ